MPEQADKPVKGRVKTAVHRTVTIRTVDDKVGYELANVNGQVTIKKLAQNRQAVIELRDLELAVAELRG